MIDLRLGNCLELMGGGIADRSVDMILTDPPYLIGYRTNYRKDKEHRFCREIIGDRDIKLVQEFAKQAYRVLKENSAMYCFCHSSKIDIFKQIICKQGFTLKNIIIWEKNNHTAGDLKAQYGKQYEMILYANKGRRVFSSGRKRYTDIWQFARVPLSKAVHQNQKPIGLLVGTNGEGKLSINFVVNLPSPHVSKDRLDTEKVKLPKYQRSSTFSASSLTMKVMKSHFHYHKERY